MPQREYIRLLHMLEAAEKALVFSENRSRIDLDTNEEFSLAIVRLLEIIGEAANSFLKKQGKNDQKFLGELSLEQEID